MTVPITATCGPDIAAWIDPEEKLQSAELLQVVQPGPITQSDRNLFMEAQALLRHLPSNIGKARFGGRWTAAQAAMLARVDEAEKIIGMKKWAAICDEMNGASRVRYEAESAVRRAKALKELEAVGLKVGEKVQRVQQHMLLGPLGSRVVYGKVKVGKDGLAYVSSPIQRGRLCLQGWTAATA